LCAFQPRTITSLLQHCEFRVLITESAPVIFNRGFRTMAKLLLFWMSQTLHYFSFGRIVVGYSTLIVAQPAS
jgi:hypothetical protein